MPTIFGHNSLYYVIKYISPTIVASVPLGEPIIASILAFFIFQVSILRIFKLEFSILKISDPQRSKDRVRRTEIHFMGIRFVFNGND